MSRGRSLPTALAMLLFLGLCLLYRDYVIDDAFIIFRFAHHFSEGMGWVWNPGEGPVRGFTSFTWALVIAASCAAGIGPVVAAKVFAALAGLGVILLTARAGRRLSPAALALVLAGISANAAYAFVVSEGLETGLAALLAAAISAAARELSSGEARLRDGFRLFGLGLLAYWTRPDAAVFIVGLSAALMAIKSVRGERESLRALALSGAAAAVVLAALTCWHYRYFGDVFPTSYYLKVSAQRGLNPRAAALLLGFIGPVMLPLWVAAVALRHEFERRRAIEVLPLFVGVAAFLVSSLFVDPIQGFCFRFLFPMYPPLVLALVHLVSSPDRIAEPRWPLPAIVSAYVLSFSLVWFAWPQCQNNDSDDLQLVGRALSDLSGRMFVTESGAVPYYSDWQSRDLVGLTWPETARSGLDRKQLEDLNPDLVLVHEPSGSYRPHLRRKMLLNAYMVERGFLAAAAISKCPGERHFYFVRRDSPLRGELVARLQNVPGVEYGNLEELMGEPRIPKAGAGEGKLMSSRDDEEKMKRK